MQPQQEKMQPLQERKMQPLLGMMQPLLGKMQPLMKPSLSGKLLNAMSGFPLLDWKW